MRAAIALQKKLRLLTEKYSVEMSTPLINSIVESCVKKEVKEYRKTLFRFAVNLSGQFSVVLISKLVRTSRKPMILCPSCQTKSLVDIFQHKDRSFRRDRAPCTCNRVQSDEKWLLRIYNPLNSAVVEEFIGAAKIKEVLRKSRKAREELLTKNNVSTSLVGETFGRLRSLFSFQGDEKRNKHEIDVTPAEAALRAREESSALPLLPKHLSTDLNNELDNIQHNNSVERMQSTTFQTTIMDYDGPVVHDIPATKDASWEPFSALRRSFIYKKRLYERANELSKHMKFCLQRMTHCREVAAVKSAHAESLEFNCEDARSLLLRTLYDIDLAEKRIKQAMLLSKELLSDFSMEESNVKEEWKQSYEGIEDASAWKGLNRKRKLEKLFEQYALAYKSIWESFAPIHEERTKARIAAKTAESAFLIAKSELEECERALAPAEAVCSNLLSLAWETSSSLLACFSMPFKQKFPQRRRFQVVDYSLVFVRDALERVRRKNRGAFALLEQRVVGLRPGKECINIKKVRINCSILS